MANTDSPRGFVPVSTLTGGCFHVGRYPVDASNATAIFKGDLISMEADGNVAPSAVDDGIVVLGAAVGLEDSLGAPINYLAASTAGYVLVCDSPDAIFQVQADGTTAVTDRFATANHVAGAGNTLTGVSGHELDSSDAGTGAQLRILGKVNKPNNAWGANVDLLVTLNEHALKDTTTI